MGCGQSKIHLYPRKSKSKANGKKSGNDLVDADAEEDDEGHRETEKELNGHGKSQQHHQQAHHLRNEDDETIGLAGDLDGKLGADDSGLNGEITIPIARGKNLSLLQNQDVISSSQQNFFKMLDQKIEEGPDYDSSSETEIALEEARLNALVQHWESASITASLCSSTSRSLQSTPIRQSNAQPMRMQAPSLMSGDIVNKIQSLNSNLMMSPKRDQRVLPQAALMQQQGYQMTMVPMQQQQQQPLQPQYQYQNPAMTLPQSYLPQQYATAATTGGMLRTGPRMLPVGGLGPVGVGVGMPGNGVIGPGMAPGQPTIGYYSQHPAMMPTSLQMAYSAGVPIPQTNPNQAAAAYYGELMQQHPIQVPSNAIQMQQQQQQMNPMMGYNPLITGGMGMSMADASMSENKFPAAISVQRLAPQVQRQIREIKDSCSQLYGSPGPPQQSGLPPPPLQTSSSGVVPPPPPQRTSTLRKNVNVGNSVTANNNNNTSYETHSQEYS